MAPNRLMIISDDAEMSQVTGYALRRRGWDVISAKNERYALALMQEGGADLVIIDLYRDREYEIDACRSLRGKVAIPILVLTGHRNEEHIMLAYEAGADECVSRPISIPLLTAKVTAWARRSWTVPAEALGTIEAGMLRLYPAERSVQRGEIGYHRLTNLEFRLLHLLMIHRDYPLTADFIIERVWHNPTDGDTVLLKNVIYRLRRKVEPNPSHPRYIKTLSGQGYVFTVPRDEEQYLVA